MSRYLYGFLIGTLCAVAWVIAGAVADGGLYIFLGLALTMPLCFLGAFTQDRFEP
jgi:hypothetical protein